MSLIEDEREECSVRVDAVIARYLSTFKEVHGTVVR